MNAFSVREEEWRFECPRPLRERLRRKARGSQSRETPLREIALSIPPRNWETAEEAFPPTLRPREFPTPSDKRHRSPENSPSEWAKTSLPHPSRRTRVRGHPRDRSSHLRHRGHYKRVFGGSLAAWARPPGSMSCRRPKSGEESDANLPQDREKHRERAPRRDSPGSARRERSIAPHRRWFDRGLPGPLRHSPFGRRQKRPRREIVEPEKERPKTSGLPRRMTGVTFPCPHKPRDLLPERPPHRRDPSLREQEVGPREPCPLSEGGFPGSP